MLITLTVASKEVEDFVLELQIDGDNTFADLNRLIRHECWPGETPAQPSTIYICDHRWHPERVIPEKGDYEHDSMDEVTLSDLLDDEGQRLIYDFDHASSRHLIMEVSSIAYGKGIDEGRCRFRQGEAPRLSIEEESSPASVEALLAQLNASALVSLSDDEDDEEPGDDSDGFNDDELDLEGFEISKG